MVLYSTNYRYFTIVSEVSPRVGSSTHSIYTCTRVKWLPLLVIVVRIEQNGVSN